MTHTYKVSGMTCSGCQKKVQELLSKVNDVKNVSIDLVKGEATIDMEKHISTPIFKEALQDYPKYQLSESPNHAAVLNVSSDEEEPKTWIETYKPIFLVFGYISGVSLLATWTTGGFSWMRWMNHFMAGFFLVFSFFKLINLRGFAESYAMYDIVAKKWNGWGYMYAFVELGLGIAYLTGFNLHLTNAVTFIVMSISLVGVLQTVLNKRQIKCACLGTFFNLPMSIITIVEDALMIVMSLLMFSLAV
jgi:copper chaperone CopZ